MTTTVPSRRPEVTERGSNTWLPLLLILALIAPTGCSEQDESEADTGTIATTGATTPTVATTDAVTSSDEVVASFNGTTCTYRGPERVSPTEAVTVSFTNESDVKAELFITTFRSEELEEVLSLIGAGDVGPDPADLPSPSSFAIELASDPGETTTHNVLLVPGTWIVDCHTYEPGVQGPAHLWFVGALESS